MSYRQRVCRTWRQAEEFSVSGLVCHIEKDLIMSNFPLNHMNMLHQGTAKWTHCYL